VSRGDREAWPELPETRQRAFLTALIERIDIGDNQIDIHIRPTRLAALLNLAAESSAADDDQILSVPVELADPGGRSRCG
jgi:hypothetical protein